MNSFCGSCFRFRFFFYFTNQYKSNYFHLSILSTVTRTFSNINMSVWSHWGSYRYQWHLSSWKFLVGLFLTLPPGSFTSPTFFGRRLNDRPISTCPDCFPPEFSIFKLLHLWWFLILSLLVTASKNTHKSSSSAVFTSASALQTTHRNKSHHCLLAFPSPLTVILPITHQPWHSSPPTPSISDLLLLHLFCAPFIGWKVSTIPLRGHCRCSAHCCLPALQMCEIRRVPGWWMEGNGMTSWMSSGTVLLTDPAHMKGSEFDLVFSLSRCISVFPPMFQMSESEL